VESPIDKLNGTPNPFAIVKRVVKKPKKRVIEKKIPEVVKIVEPTSHIDGHIKL